MEMSTLYWLTRLEYLSNLFFGIMIMSLILIPLIAIIGSVASHSCGIPFPRTAKIMLKIYVPLLIVSSIGTVFTPNNKDLAIIFGGYYAFNNEELQKMPTKSFKVINKFMDEYLEQDK